MAEGLVWVDFSDIDYRLNLHNEHSKVLIYSDQMEQCGDEKIIVSVRQITVNHFVIHLQISHLNYAQKR